LIVFSDGGKSADDQLLVNKVRNFIDSIRGFKSVTLHKRPYNFGLAKSIIEGVTQVFNEYDSIIVLEDDLVTSPYFLSYMNTALNLFKNDDRVISIHGYAYPVQTELPEVFFLRGADCWGWATWRRGWSIFNPDGQVLLNELQRRNLQKDLDFQGGYGFTQMLRDNINCKNDSWAIRWHVSAFLAGKLTLHPGRSLVQNIGNDGSGTHCGGTGIFDVSLSPTPINLSLIKQIEISSEGMDAYKSFYFKLKPNLLKKIFHSMRALIEWLHYRLKGNL
jgi:hypothetical protein